MSGQKGETMAGRKHKQASQAAGCHHTAFCSQPVSGFHRQNQAWKPRRVQAVGLRMLPREPGLGSGWSGDTRSVGLSGLLKRRGVIGLLLLPDGVENARPHVCQGSHRDGMALSLSSFALIILLGPDFLVRTRPAKLLQGIAPGLDTAQPAMRDLLRPALKKNWRGAGESLPTAGTFIAAAVIAAFGQQTRSETFASSWQGLEELAVGMPQKKAFDLLVIVSNLLEERFQLVYQGQHQPRFGARRDRVGLQARLLELPSQVLGGFAGPWIPGLFQQGCQIFDRGRAGRLQGGIGAQKRERRGLLQLAEQFQNDGVIRFETSRELVDQAGLHVDQSILVARQRFELLDLFTVRIESAQILEIGSSGFGQQVSINGIGLGPGGSAPPLDGSGVDRIDGPSLLPQMGNQQSVGGLHNTCQLLFSSWSCYSLQVGVQLVQSLGAMRYTNRSQLTALFVNAQRIMIG
jgi:hypothetical protein